MVSNPFPDRLNRTDLGRKMLSNQEVLFFFFFFRDRNRIHRALECTNQSGRVMRTRVHIYPALFIPSSVLLNLFHFVWKDSSSARDKSVLSEEKNRDEKLEPRWIRNILASRWISRKLSPKNDFEDERKKVFFPDTFVSNMSPLSSRSRRW